MTDARSERIRAIPKLQLAPDLDLSGTTPERALVDDDGRPVIWYGPAYEPQRVADTDTPRRAKEGESWV